MVSSILLTVIGQFHTALPLRVNKNSETDNCFEFFQINFDLGAQKLCNQNPLQNLLPVDEFLPLMFDKQPK